MFKQCTKCLNWKTFDCFSRHTGAKASKTGIRSTCKVCESLYSAAQHIKNREYNSLRKSITNAARYDRNPSKAIASASNRRAIRLNATPAWANHKKIAEIYANCPPGMHVDHIVPLQSDLVCGLHWEGNLQYLEAAKNLAKRNKWDVWEDSKQFD